MNEGFWKGLLIVCIIMLAVLVGSVPFADPDSATFIIIQLSAIHIFVAMAIISALLYFDWDPFRALR